MTVETPGGPAAAIIERAKAIILKPADTWPVIERETIPSGEIFTGYVVPLAAIGPVAQLIGGQLFGWGAFGIVFRPSLTSGLSMAIFSYVMALVGVFVIAFAANKLSPNFGGETSSRNAFKLVAYSMTAGWLAGIFNLVPSLGFLALIGLYSFYLFYVGCGPLLKVPQDKALTFTIVTVICVIVIYVVIGALSTGVGRLSGGFPTPASIGGSVSDSGGSVSIPGVGTIDTGKIEQAARDVEAAANGKTSAVAPASLQALLPGSIGGYTRTAVESQKVGPVSSAEGTYEAGGKRFTLKVADMTAIGAFAGMAGAIGVESNKENADGYERTTTTDGNIRVEQWDKSATSGKFSQMIGKRFMIEADGSAGSIDELKAAVASIDQGKLVSLAGS